MLPHPHPAMPLANPYTCRCLADLSDTALVRLVTHHNEQALETLYHRYARRAYGIAMRITDDPGTAEEVVQDVFHNIWQSANSFHDNGAVAPWISGIAWHRAIDAMRSKLGRARAREQLLAADLPDGGESDGARIVEHAQLCTAIHMALATLPSAQRHAIELAYVRGLTCREIAIDLARRWEPSKPACGSLW